MINKLVFRGPPHRGAVEVLWNDVPDKFYVGLGEAAKSLLFKRTPTREPDPEMLAAITARGLIIEYVDVAEEDVSG